MSEIIKNVRKDFLDPSQKYEGLSKDAPHLGGYVSNHLMTGTWCPDIWDLMIQAWNVRSMTDVGCGEGQVARWFGYRGIESFGVDGCDGPSDGFKRLLWDYATGPLETQPRDLCWSAEFVEHVDEQYVPNFLATFRQHRRLALTHAFPGHAGYHHVNCREPSYWIKLLEADGWTFDYNNTHDLRCAIGRDSFPARCVKESLLIFKR